MASRSKNANEESTPRDAEYTVVARRYRPQQFADLVGQEPVAQALTNALKSGRVAHAYLFTGARGVGKTSTARILAKALNCVEGPTSTPCDRCDVCLAVAAGDDIDVLEIDGASNRGIDEIRTIRQNVHTRPSRARYKIYIIDEVHMLTRESFNALLKTLEEPPAHVKFIFATTEVQKIPITILSRCQRFDFAGIGASRIVTRLREIVQAEGMQADDDALQLVARRAGGSMRDAQSLLDQLLAFGSDRLTADQVHRLLGTAADDRVAGIATSIFARDVPAALQQLTACVDEGLQLGELLDQMIEYWRALMLVASAGPEVSGLHVTEAQKRLLVEQAQARSVDTILAGLDVLTVTKSRLRSSHHAQVLLEMAFVRLSRLEDLLSVTHLVQLLANPNADLAAIGAKLKVQGGATLTATSPPSVPPPAVDTKKKTPLLSEANRNGTGNVKSQPAPAAGPVRLSEENLADVWGKMLGRVGAILAGQLVKALSPAIIGPKTIGLRFPATAHLQYDMCKDPSNVQRVEATLKQITQEEWSVRLEFDANATGVGQDVPAPGNGLSAQDMRREALKIPLLNRIVDVLGGNMMRLDPDFGTEVGRSVAADDADDADRPDTPTEEV